MNNLVFRMRERWRTRQSFFPSTDEWSVALGLAGLVLLPTLGKWLWIWLGPIVGSNATSTHWKAVSRNGTETKWGLPILEADDPTLTFAFYAAAFILVVSTLVLFFALLVFVLHSNQKRSEGARAIAVQALAFLITSGGGVFAYLGFKA
jgi:hypothetical protein